MNSYFLFFKYFTLYMYIMGDNTINIKLIKKDFTKLTNKLGGSL